MLHTESLASARVHEEAGLIPPRHDVKPLIDAATALLAGKGTYPYYGDSVALGYAPPYIPLLAPLALLPRGATYLISVLASAGLTVAALAAWARRDGGFPGWFWAVALALPVVTLVRIDQLMSAWGLAAATGAVFAQRRGHWWLAGALVGLALVRTANTLPILAMLLLCAWRNPRDHLGLIFGVASVMVPLCAIATWWDVNWVPHYLHNLQVLPIVGPVRAMRDAYGSAGPLGLQLVSTGAAVALAWPDRGGRLDLDHAAMALAITLLAAVMAGFYAAVFVLPALIRVALRPGLAAVAWMTAFVPWLVFLAFTTFLLGPTSIQPGILPASIDFVLLAGCYPLLRPRLRPVALQAGR